MLGSPEPDVPLFDHCRRAALSSEKGAAVTIPHLRLLLAPIDRLTLGSANAPAYDPNPVRPVAQPTA